MQDKLKPKKLCHYTDIGALMGIVDNNTIWATQSLYLNDYKEINYGAELLREQLYEYESSGEPEKIEFALLLTTFADQIDMHAQRVYITSFSTEDNQLSQWRGYTPANKGVSLTFNLDIIFRLLKDNSDIFLTPCLYDVDDLPKTMITKTLEAFFERFKENSKNGSAKTLKSFSLAVYRTLLQIFVSIKTSDFAEEKEWRLITVKEPNYQGEDLHFREGQSMLIPYLKIKLKPEADERLFSNVLAGPSQPHNLLQSAISQFNRKAFFTYSLGSSRISYRDW